MRTQSWAHTLVLGQFHGEARNSLVDPKHFVGRSHINRSLEHPQPVVVRGNLETILLQRIQNELGLGNGKMLQKPQHHKVTTRIDNDSYRVGAESLGHNVDFFVRAQHLHHGL
jgi:hypothetical protein